MAFRIWAIEAGKVVFIFQTQEKRFLTNNLTPKYNQKSTRVYGAYMKMANAKPW